VVLLLIVVVLLLVLVLQNRNGGDDEGTGTITPSALVSTIDGADLSPF
jgi:hypothetical protein